MELFEERHQQVRGIHGAVLQSNQRKSDEATGCDLEAELGACRQPEITAVYDFEIVVGKTNGAEHERGKHGAPDKGIAQVRPQKRRHDDADGDKQSAHGGRPGFFLMRLRTFLADVLADLKFAQAADDDRADDESGKQSGQASEGGAKRQVTKNTERREVVE